ncbi:MULTISPECIES: hypothetical protein [Deinococcus]|uniref:Peptidase M4 n=1 Tax=Deinococcus rufus TaxID=2136097 RepID=A0ABV7Z5Y1_9DEIO|nr:hypothetical protein [Deinococcus sp. AB2017081]WQE97150.1 hypothetical protein U2P90_18920 [Deinococcus sp. AB2017081]
MTSSSSSRPYDTPQWRRLRVYALDPSLDLGIDTALINQTFVRVPWEHVTPGPVDEYLEVIDIDPASGCCYEPVNLDHPSLLAQDGLLPSTGDPRFHQQMVYAIARTTIRHFERALGRTAFWADDHPPDSDEPQFVQRLRIYPHAMAEENAFYDPDRVALLFGYFAARPRRSAQVMPRGTVFTCLSHDVIAHETTHALLDGMHPRFTEATNPDVLAFHEAFSDLVALFLHFTFPDVVRNQIAQTQGDLGRKNLLADLAREFGQGTGLYGALRSALDGLDEPGSGGSTDTPEYENLLEPHQRGAVLVGAVFDAFNMIYKARTSDLLRLASGGSGILGPGALHPDLVARLADEASLVAERVLHMCIRALDYCPPVDLTFGEFLRAIITADFEHTREDGWAYRTAMIEAFRRRGIYPSNVNSLSETSLRWQEPTDQEQLTLSGILMNLDVLNAIRQQVQGWALGHNRERAWRAMAAAKTVLSDHLSEFLSREQADQATSLLPGGVAAALGLNFQKRGLEVHSVRPARRIEPDGQSQLDLVIELTQSFHYSNDALRQAINTGTPLPAQAKDGDFVFRGGCTLLVDLEALPQEAKDDASREAQATPVKLIRYCVRKHVDSVKRLERVWRYVNGDLNAGLRAMYFGLSNGTVLNEPFALVHRQASEGR